MTVSGPIRAPATSRSGTVTSVAVVTPVAPTIWVGRLLWSSRPARSIAEGERTVRSAPVSTTSVSGTPLRRAATVIGAPGLIRSSVGSPPGVGVGRGCGALKSSAASRKAGGIVSGSAV